MLLRSGLCVLALMMVTTAVYADDIQDGIYQMCLTRQPAKKAQDPRAEAFCTCYAEELAQNSNLSQATKLKLTKEFPKDLNKFLGSSTLAHDNPDAMLLVSTPFKCMEKVDPNAIKVTGVSENPAQASVRSGSSMVKNSVSSPIRAGQSVSMGDASLSSAHDTQKSEKENGLMVVSSAWPEKALLEFTKKIADNPDYVKKDTIEKHLSIYFSTKERTIHYISDEGHAVHPAFISVMYGVNNIPASVNAAYAGNRVTFDDYYDAFVAALRKSLPQSSAQKDGVRQLWSGSFSEWSPADIDRLRVQAGQAEGYTQQELAEVHLVVYAGQRGTNYYFTTQGHENHPSFIKVARLSPDTPIIYTGGHAGNADAFKTYFNQFTKAMGKN